MDACPASFQRGTACQGAQSIKNNYSVFGFSFLKSTINAMLNTIDKPVSNPMINEIEILSSTKWFSKMLIAIEICPIAK